MAVSPHRSRGQHRNLWPHKPGPPLQTLAAAAATREERKRGGLGGGVCHQCPQRGVKPPPSSRCLRHEPRHQSKPRGLLHVARPRHRRRSRSATTNHAGHLLGEAGYRCCTPPRPHEETADPALRTAARANPSTRVSPEEVAPQGRRGLAAEVLTSFPTMRNGGWTPGEAQGGGGGAGVRFFKGRGRTS